jgi:hypothetical protein
MNESWAIAEAKVGPPMAIGWAFVEKEISHGRRALNPSGQHHGRALDE